MWQPKAAHRATAGPQEADGGDVRMTQEVHKEVHKTFDPTEEAKKLGIWPVFKTADGEFIPITDPTTGKSIEGRDAAYARISLLKDAYKTWATGKDGIIEDPGFAPSSIEPPMKLEDTSDRDGVKFREVTDAWFDSVYLTEYLPSSELWATANALWAEKEADKRDAELAEKAKSAPGRTILLTARLEGDGTITVTNPSAPNEQIKNLTAFDVVRIDGEIFVEATTRVGMSFPSTK
jgi:hypothetical protein